MKGLVDDGTTVNCRDCVYSHNCNVASAHKYSVGSCWQFEPKPDPSDRAEPRRPFVDFLMDVVRDGYSVKFDYNAEANAICVECATTNRKTGNRRLHRMFHDRDFRQTLDPDWLVKMVIRRMTEELE